MRRVVLLAALFACADPTLVVRPFPPLDGARSAILVISRAEPRLGPIVIADEVSDGRLSWEFTDEEEQGALTLDLLLYDASLSGLGLFPGQQNLVPAGSGRRLPRGARLFRGASTTNGSEWEPLTTWPGELEALQIEERRLPSDLCPTFRMTPLDPAKPLSPSGFAFFAPYDDARAIFGAPDGSLHFISAAGATLATHSSTAAPLRSAAQTPDGARWWLSTDGRFFGGDPERGLAPAPSIPPPTLNRSWMAGASSGETTEVFALFESQKFARFDGAQWTELSPARANRLDDRGGVAWIEPGHAAALNDDSQSVIIYRGGRVDRRNLVNNANDELRTLVHVPGYGLVVASVRGYIWSAQDSLSFEPLAISSQVDLVVRTILPFGPGLLFAGNDGLVQVYLPDYGLCPTESLGTGRIERALWLGEQLLIAHDLVNQGDVIDVSILVPDRAP
ncbi:MAG: hypothetical protein IPG45_23510 [Deltaproteobacteria bacterium]|nr:hypothetical protein [Deltaproteobacteria bacterium]